ncbi:MAG: MBL fold metallo-hydrolase [Spirochaetales bacterium]|nr:MBL fold metallo-hydrolase [Spirochaetales bacterium]
MHKIYNGLWRHTTYNDQIDLTFNQYFLEGEEPLLVHTGSSQDAPALLRALQGKKISYIFVSHFESDECGALCPVLETYPSAKVITGEVTARQFKGFGIHADVLVAEANQTITVGDFEFLTIAYPSEMHLWDGLLLYEKRHKIFFSSDLMIRFGNSDEEVLKSKWKDEVEAISAVQVADEARRNELKATLLQLDVALVAPGHGPALQVK